MSPDVFVNMEDWLRSRKQPHNVSLVCPHCPLTRRRTVGPASTFVRCEGRSEEEAFACVPCMEDLQRAFGTPDLVRDDWGKDCELANDVRAVRNRLLNDCAWTVLNDCPLTQETQAEWLEYRRKLNRITADFAKPSQVEWPRKPQSIVKDA